jgi:hypothetical protein
MSEQDPLNRAFLGNHRRYLLKLREALISAARNAVDSWELSREWPSALAR